MLELLRSKDGWDHARQMACLIAEIKEEWAGIPIPVGDETPLVIEKSYPFADIFNRKADDTGLEPGEKLRNIFWSHRYRCHVFIVQLADGKIKHYIDPGANQCSMIVNTMACSLAWGIEQEHNALNLLGTLIKHHHFKSYLLTGSFVESSKRSGLTYIFRKLRPTIVLDARDKSDGRPARILAALCMHPIAYYQGTWAGAMTPSDEVVAHLMMMRGDEHLYWKRCNQHAPGRPEAGL